MKAKELHRWDVSPAEARQLQMELAALVSRENSLREPSLIAGSDISAPDSSGAARVAVVVLSFPGLELVETKVTSGKLSFPYVPGLLSFREAPLLLATFERLTVSPDLIMVDGQGYAHPRRMGIASHLGLLLDTPTIGCAKSRLCGTHDAVGEAPGSYSELVDNGEVIGAALRTKERSRPLYVSIGHKVDLAAAVRWVMACAHGYRLPEPTRLAHLVAVGHDLSSLRQRAANAAATYKRG
ncbi:MAG: deoxyribonuclease V [Chloroflexi bacterium]|nr:deoxyribonuclease V [Chloroflexota bacterium]